MRMRSIASFLGSLAIAVLLTAAGLVLDAKMLTYAGVILLALSVVLWTYLWQFSTQSRVFIEPPLTQTILNDLYQSRTKIQADKATGIYVGKWLRVEGKVTDIDKNIWGGPNIHLSDNNPTIFLNLPWWKTGKSMVIHKGDSIVAIGKVHHLGKTYISLIKGDVQSVYADRVCS